MGATAPFRTIAGAAAAGVASGAIARSFARRAGSMDLNGRVVVITGASRGLGYLLAREFGAQGARLGICARDGRHLNGARAELEETGAEVHAQTCDVSDQAAVRNFIDAAARRLGGVDVLVNNAGVIQVGPLATQTEEDFRQAMDVMFWGVVHATQAALPHLRRSDRPRIVNITSIGGKLSPPHLLPYASAKFAAVGFSEGLRAELAPEGIAVTTVVPGLMRTGSHRNALFKGWRGAEYAWFAVGAASPLTSVSAEHAARRIVRATRRGDAEIMIGAPAHLAARAVGLFPGVTADLLGAVQRALPWTDVEDLPLIEGHELSSELTRSPITAPGRRAAARLRQHDDEQI